MAPFVEVDEWLQALMAPSVAGAEPSVVSPLWGRAGGDAPIDGEGTARGGDLGDMRKMAQGRDGWKEWKVKMEEEILVRV